MRRLPMLTSPGHHWYCLSKTQTILGNDTEYDNFGRSYGFVLVRLVDESLVVGRFLAFLESLSCGCVVAITRWSMVLTAFSSIGDAMFMSNSISTSCLGGELGVASEESIMPLLCRVLMLIRDGKK